MKTKRACWKDSCHVVIMTDRDVIQIFPVALMGQIEMNSCITCDT